MVNIDYIKSVKRKNVTFVIICNLNIYFLFFILYDLVCIEKLC